MNLRVCPLLAVALSSVVAGCPGPEQQDDAGRVDVGPGVDARGLDAGRFDARLDAVSIDAAVDAYRPVPTGSRRVIYQLVPRLFGNTNTTRMRDGTIAQNGSGHFADIDARALSEIRALGATDVWLTGALRQATLTSYESVDPRLAADDPDVVKGRAGSFYAVRDYYDVSPDYAVDPARRLDEFDALITRMHAADLRVIIDLVPNHVARSYASVVHPERDFGHADNQGVFFTPSNQFFYLQDPPGRALSLSRPSGWNPPGVTFDGAFAREDGSAGHAARATGNNQTSTSLSANDWYETVKLNYGFDFTRGVGSYDPVPATWIEVDQILAYWQERGVDGFRCDFAHYVPNEAWRYLISRAQMRDANVYFFAEAYENLPGLLSAGFDAVYHDAAYDTLKGIYLGQRSQSDLDSLLGSLGDDARGSYLHYLENHDERRVASPIVTGGSTDDSGFGGAAAGYQLAPLVYLYSDGPVLLYNGQEVGEEGAGIEGFGGEDGRTSIFDYWSMPALAGWVNGHAYDGGGLTDSQRRLRAFYADLLALSQDAAATGSRFWGLDYWNTSSRFGDADDNLFSFARFETSGGRILIVAANFAPGRSTTGHIRIPSELADAAGLDGARLYTVRRVLDEGGAESTTVGAGSRALLVSDGFAATVADQSSAVFIIE